jgi:hypothetical protein
MQSYFIIKGYIIYFQNAEKSPVPKKLLDVNIGYKKVLVSLGPAPAQAQPLGQVKVAIISASFFSSFLFH